MASWIFLLLAFALSVQAEEKMEPSVAFVCSQPAMHTTQTGLGWVKDDSAGCLKDPADILNYCRKVFPDLDIRNVVEGSHKVTIQNWCAFGVSSCDQQYTVTPFRCLVGPFQSDALLVPEHCLFDHIHNSKLCASFNEWNQTSKQSCLDRGMTQQNFAMLQPCGIDKFNGVEFVCCPSKKGGSQKIESLTTKAKPIPVTEPPKASKVVGRKMAPQPVSSSSVLTDYMGQTKSGRRWNEHEYYARAKADMQKHHHDKITQMMKDWASARQRVQELKSKDPKRSEKLNKEITNRFQKMYEAEEVEGEMEKKQLSSLHQQRVQADLDERKRKALDVYIQTIDDDETDVSEILKALRQYVKTLQKDRLHTVKHYQHLQENDPEEAESERSKIADHLRNIDQQLQGALDMLNRVPRSKNKILREIQDNLDAYHSVDYTVSMIVLVDEKNKPTTKPEAVKDEVAEDDEGYRNDKDDDDDDNDDEDNDDDDNDDEYDDDVNDKKTVFDEFDADDDETDDDDENSEDERLPEEKVKTEPTTTMQPTTRTTLPVPKQRKGPRNGDVVQSKPKADPIAGHVMDSKISVVEHEYIQKDTLHGVSGGFGSAMPLGIAVGGLTVLVVIVVGVVLMRRSRRQHSPVPRGSSLEVDCADSIVSPEERHVVSMQMNGYENPTYKYFEQNVKA